MARSGLLALLMGAALVLSGCAYWHPTGKAVSGINSSSPNAVQSAASGSTGGGENQFTHAQISPGSPAGANLNLQ